MSSLYKAVIIPLVLFFISYPRVTSEDSFEFIDLKYYTQLTSLGSHLWLYRHQKDRACFSSVGQPQLWLESKLEQVHCIS